MNKKKKSMLILGIMSLLLIGIGTAITTFSVHIINLNEKNKVSAESLKKETKPSNLSQTNISEASIKTTSSSTIENKIERAKQAAAKYIDSKNVGVYCIDLKSGESFGINQNKTYYAASTAKLPGILYTQKKINEGVINENTEFAYHDYVNNIPGAMIRGGTGKLKDNVHDGELVSVGTLLKYACSYSDNLASNMLGYYVCDKNDGAFKTYTSNVISKDITEFSKDFSAKETAILMKAIYAQGGQAIINLKDTSWDNVKIPKYLPVNIAHKIGVNGDYNHDVAMVYANSPYIISIMTEGCSDEFIAQLSKKVYAELSK